MTIQELIALMMEDGPNHCQCKTCKRRRQLGKIINKLDDEADQKFLMDSLGVYTGDTIVSPQD